MRHELLMLQVWKITVPADSGQTAKLSGWVLAETTQEAQSLSGYTNAVIKQEPERLWIAKERIIWESSKSA